MYNEEYLMKMTVLEVIGILKRDIESSATHSSSLHVQKETMTHLLPVLKEEMILIQPTWRVCLLKPRNKRFLLREQHCQRPFQERRQYMNASAPPP